MQFQLNATPIIFGILILALVGAVLGFAAPEILKVTNLQNQMRMQQAEADARIANEQARASVAPTIAAKEVELKALEVVSQTNAIRYASELHNAEISAKQQLAQSQSEATIIAANADLERSKVIGTGLLILLGISATTCLIMAARKCYLDGQKEKHMFLLEQGVQEIRKQEIQILSKAVDTLSQRGGEMLLENGRTLRFQPVQSPIMLQDGNVAPTVIPVKTQITENVK